jgi:hypothetical protein
MDAFNDMIDEAELRELNRGGSRYTWTNKQLHPIQSVLDRVFVNNSWEDMFPLVRVQAMVRIGSDHNPLLVNSGPPERKPPHYFRFEPYWILHEDFTPWVLSKCPQRHKQRCLDHWHVVSSKLRRAMKGWGANCDSARRKHKQEILLEIKNLDGKSDLMQLSEEEWKRRYELENEL